MTSSEPNPIDMKKLLLCALALISVISCGPKRQKSANLSLNELVKPELVYPEQGIFATEGRYLIFGQIGFEDRSFQEDTLLFPPIEGLVHGSVYALCPKDTCFAEYAVLALRCPPIQPLLNWVADTVNTFVQGCPIGNGLLTYNDKQLDIPVKHLKTDKEICDYYIGQLRHAYDNWHCTGEGDHNILNEQAGLLLADCWHTGNLYSFYRIDWYDWMSGGNNARESWWTVDATSGKLLGLSDFILPDKLDTLAALMMPRLVNGKDSFILDQYHHKPEEYTGVLQSANGSALIPEGLVLYFYPYNLGFGADGEYEAVIPYVKLGGILKEPLAAALIPSPEDEDTDVRQYVQEDQKPSIDLFGIEMVGTPKRLIRELARNSFIQIDLGSDGFINYRKDGFSTRVLLEGNPFGMNVTYENEGEEGVVKDVAFITSETDHRILDTIVKSLKSYYGKPTIVDMPEEYYKWFPRGHFLHVRPLHHDDGGWTFYITRNQN